MGKYLEEDAFFTEELKVLYKIAPPSHIYKYYAPENKAKRKPNARDILFIGNDLQRTGAPIVLLDMVRVVLENGDHPVVISLLDGVLRQEYLDMGITVIIDNSICDDTEESSHTFEAFARNFDLIVVNTLTCGRTISALNNSLPPVLWWIHECPFTIDYFKNFLPDKPGANIFAYSPSNYMANALNNAGLNYDFGRLTYGIYDLSESKAQAEDQEKVLFLMVGSIEYNKGHDIVIRAIEHLDKETLEKVQLTIIGTANDPETIKLCETAAEKYSNITIPGAMPREKLWKWYGKANCVLIPSRQEAFSMVGLEALMLSVPLICSDNVGLAEYITHNENGFIFPSENHIELAKYITFMVKNRDKTTQMGQKARKEIYEEHFTMEKFKGKVLNTIDEVLKK